MSQFVRPAPSYRKPWESHRVRLEGARKQALETGRNRVLMTAAVFAFAFTVVAGRLVDLTVLERPGEPLVAEQEAVRSRAADRADVVDRNGVILATSLPTVSVYADPTEVLDPEEAADKLRTVLPNLDRQDIVDKLSSRGRFVWIQRNLTPVQQYNINHLGIPGLQFQQGYKRVYPHGRTASHLLGLTDVDGRGIAGVERSFDGRLRSDDENLKLSIDIRVQSILRDELVGAVGEFKALGAAGLVLDVDTGETVAMVSLPDFDPNAADTLRGEAGFNRAAKGVYEMGSTFKLFTAAMALDAGTVTLESGYDASKPLRVARFSITDYHAKNRWLSVPEIIVHSSNIGAAKMALDVGTDAQRRYLSRFGLLSAPAIELPEVGKPLVPARWREINTMTISFGHGIAVSPLQLASAVGTLVNGGVRYAPTLLRRQPGDAIAGERVLAPETSKKVRGLMELVVRHGTGKNAGVAGYRVGGKTGTAEKQVGGRYQRKSLISSFVGAFPMENPRYVVLAVLDEPRGNKRTFNYATGGWVAAPVVSHTISRMAPLMGIAPLPADGGGKPVKKTIPARGKLLVALRAAIADAREAQGASH
jgi:cell division protein FtsI (penicillin-binding protein 3)